MTNIDEAAWLWDKLMCIESRLNEIANKLKEIKAKEAREVERDIKNLAKALEQTIDEGFIPDEL